MSNTTIAQTLFAPSQQPERAAASVFGRWLAAVELAQQKRANAIVRSYFGRMSDAQLAAYGFTPEQVKILRNSRETGLDWL